MKISRVFAIGIRGVILQSVNQLVAEAGCAGKACEIVKVGPRRKGQPRSMIVRCYHCGKARTVNETEAAFESDLPDMLQQMIDCLATGTPAGVDEANNLGRDMERLGSAIVIPILGCFVLWKARGNLTKINELAELLSRTATVEHAVGIGKILTWDEIMSYRQARKAMVSALARIGNDKAVPYLRIHINKITTMQNQEAVGMAADVMEASQALRNCETRRSQNQTKIVGADQIGKLLDQDDSIERFGALGKRLLE
jgi:hypothetical protein